MDNTNERILHSLIFRYIETRGYYDATAAPNIQTWSDEEDEREKRRSSASEPMKSTTLKPNNILKVINKYRKFLLYIFDEKLTHFSFLQLFITVTKTNNQ